MLISTVVKNFLDRVPVNFAPDLTSRFSVEMETQIMVDQHGGEAVYEGTELKRNTWQISGDSKYGTYKYHHIRIPRDSMSNPYFNDYELRFPLERHVEYIGMTGWNWKQKKSLWIAFDYDSITGHAQGVGISDEALEQVKQAACDIPWIQVRRSTGGSGLHLYAYFDYDAAPDAENHNVHAAVGRAVLGLMQKSTNFDFAANLDVYGGNMWVWSRKVSPENRGLAIIKDMQDYCPALPDNWRDHLDVVTGKRSKIRVFGIPDGDWDAFEQQASARNKTNIDEKHREIESRIIDAGYTIQWVADHNCWQTHTRAFKDIMDAHPGEYKGLYETLSEGKDRGKPNCFAFPLPDGALKISRFGRGAKEHELWAQSPNEWTTVYFNMVPTLREAALTMGAAEQVEARDAGWVFNNFQDAQKAVELLGTRIPIDPTWSDLFLTEDRQFVIKTTTDDALIVEFEKKRDDKPLKGWVAKGRKYQRIVRGAETQARTTESDFMYDNIIRAVVGMDGDFAGWVLRDNTDWVGHNKDNIRSAMKGLGMPDPETTLGQLILNSWKLVSVPFQPEYLPDRKWNRNSPQFQVQPAEHGGSHPHWDMIFEHCGQDLDDPLKEMQWGKEYGILTGADYLLAWIAAMLRHPYEPLPYLFFYGPQNSGKSIFHEGLSLLMTCGVQAADEALKNQNGFNGELANSVLCVVEETDLSKSSSAYNRLKAWVTGVNILIHPKHQQPYQLRNTTHWCQCANEQANCPIFPGDTRITMCYVPMLVDQEIPKPLLMQHLKEEAPSLMRTIMDFRIPPAPGRLRIPVVTTESKREAEENHFSELEVFIKTKCYNIPGAYTKMVDFYEAFKASLLGAAKFDWGYNRVSSLIRERQLLIMGRALNNVCILGNLSLDAPVRGFDYGKPWVLNKGGKLIRDEDAILEPIDYDTE